MSVGMALIKERDWKKHTQVILPYGFTKIRLVPLVYYAYTNSYKDGVSPHETPLPNLTKKVLQAENVSQLIWDQELQVLTPEQITSMLSEIKRLREIIYEMQRKSHA